jgi:excisionase family DNA binding protein
MGGEREIVKMINATEMAKRLGLARSTLLRWAATNRVPAFKVGREWKFDEADVIRALKITNGNALQRASSRGRAA